MIPDSRFQIICDSVWNSVLYSLESEISNLESARDGVPDVVCSAEFAVRSG